jgi:mRNA interferase MazF
MPTSDPSVTDAPAFRPGDVVKVPFPYTDRPTRQRRPALIVSGPDLQRKHGLSWLLMITSATHRGRDGDVGIVDLGRAGLPAPSIVRCAKIAAIDSRDATYLGRVTPEVFADVHRHLTTMLACGDIQDDR